MPRGRSKKPRSYPAELRQQLIELVRVGRTPEELAREFEPSAQTIRNWCDKSTPIPAVREHPNARTLSVGCSRSFAG
jgi:transposase